MANHQHLPSSSVSPSTGHLPFQPWRNNIKIEKSDSSAETPGQSKVMDLLYHSELTADYPRLAGHPPLYAAPGNYQGPQKPHIHPELDLKLQQCIEEGNSVGDFAKKQIVEILERISLLKPPERVLLYLRMPGANCDTDPLRQPQNPLGARSEINHTINWVRSHLEPDPNVSIPKKDVYDDYTAFCGRNNIKPLSTADFGKVMKQVFPTVRPRRLGTRGHSRYCYAAMRKATKLDPPLLPDLSSPRGDCISGGGEKGHLMSLSGGGGGGIGGELDGGTSWSIVQQWAESILKTPFQDVKDLADHIVKFQLLGDGSGVDLKPGTVEAGTVKETKLKDKKKETLAKSTSPKKRKKKRNKDSSSGSMDGDGGEGSGLEPDLRFSGVQVKKEVDSGNDEDKIIDLKVHQGRGQDRETLLTDKIPVKLLLNDVPMESSVPISEAESHQIENVYCKKVRQAQQAKGLWFQQQQQPPQHSTTGQSTVIVTPHTFSLPEIPSPSMLSQMNRQQALAEREAVLAKRNKQDNDDSIPSNFMPRERVISLCTLDKDALDDYLPLAGGDNSQESEIMEYFDDTSSIGQSTVGENISPKVDDPPAPNLDQIITSSRQITSGTSSTGYPGPASASLSLLSQRHGQVGYQSAVGMDLSQDPGNGNVNRPMALKRRLMSEAERDTSEEAGQRRFMPIQAPPSILGIAAPAVHFPKMLPNTNRYDDFLSPQLATMKKHQQSELAINNEYSPPRPLAMVYNPESLNGISMTNGLVTDQSRNTAFSRTKYERPSPSDVNHPPGQEAVNMSTFVESRSQSVPLNYRQSPVHVTSSNDGASWSSSYQNANNAPSSACSSVAQTPIPPDYNEFDMNMWDNGSAMNPSTNTEDPQDQMDKSQFKDRNNNSAEEFLEEMKSFASTSAITSRSVPSTPQPNAGPSYYPKAYFNATGANPNGIGSFSNYGQQRQCYDVSKSVPTTPIASVSSGQFRYSPLQEMLSRSRDSLINGNVNLDKDLSAASSTGFGFSSGPSPGSGIDGDGNSVDGAGSAARRRIERIEQDRKNSSNQGLLVDKEMSPLEEDMGFDQIIDPDLMNQFKEDF